MNPASWEVVRRPASTDGDLEGFDLLFDSIRQVQAELAAFLSVEGVFIPTQTPLPHSSVLRFRVLLPDDFALIEGTGVVFWLRLPGEDRNQPAGMAVNFVTLGERSRELIEKIVETNLNAGGKPFDVHSKGESVDPKKPSVPVTPAPRQAAKKKVTLGMRQGTQESAKPGMSFSVRGNEPTSPPSAPAQPVVPPPPIEPDPNATVWAPPKPKAPPVAAPVEPVAAPVEDVTPPVVPEPRVEQLPVEPPVIESPVVEDVVEPEPQSVFESESAAPIFEQAEQLELELDDPEDELELAMDTQESEESLPKLDDVPTAPFAPVLEAPDAVDFEVEDPVPGDKEPTKEILLDSVSENDDALMAEEPGFWVEDEVETPVETEYEQPETHEFQPPAATMPEPEVPLPEGIGFEGSDDAGEIEPPSWGDFDDPDVSNDSSVSDVPEDVAALSPTPTADPYTEQRDMFEVPEPAPNFGSATPTPSMPDLSTPEPAVSEPADSSVREAQGQQFVFNLPDSEPESETVEDEPATPAPVKTDEKKRKRHSSGKVSSQKKSPIPRVAFFIILVAAVGAGGYFGWQWYQNQAPFDSEIAANEGAAEVIDAAAVSETGSDQNANETASDAEVEAVSSGSESATNVTEPATTDVEPAPTPAVAEVVIHEQTMGPAHIVQGISWERSASGTDVVIDCDGAFDESQLSVFPMDDPPRILVRLRRIEAGYPEEIIEAGTDELRRIRIGFHPEQSPPALYVVLDVADNSVVVLASDANANILRVKLGR